MPGENATPSEPDAAAETRRFVPGDRIELTTATNMLDSAEPAGAVVCVLPSGTRGAVVDGPVSSGNLEWLQVSTSYGDGWVMTDWLQLAQSREGPFATGTRLVTTTAVNLRRGHDVATEILYLIPSGTVMTVLEGPVAANGFDWYRVEMDTYGTGWMVSAWSREV